jgi:biotin carboxyl carrier protein
MKLTIGAKSYEIALTADGVQVDGELFHTTVEGFGGTRIVTVDGRPVRVDIGATQEGKTPVVVEGKTLHVGLDTASPAALPAGTAPTPRRAARAAAPASAPMPAAVKGAVTAQMTGRIVRVAVQPGETVGAGDLLLVLEAMKMENEVRSVQAGTVREVRVAAGDRVNKGDPLVVLDG